MAITKEKINKWEEKGKVKKLIKVLEDNDKIIQRDAVRALGKIGNERAVEPLINILNNEDEDIRGYAAEALGKIGKPALEPLIEVLKNKDKDVSEKAAFALNMFQDPRSIEPLITVLKDKNNNRNVRRASGKALQNIYFQGDLDQQSKRRIESVEWTITEMIRDIEKEKKEALERARNWWRGKPDPKDENFICDACGGPIKEKDGTSLVGGWMRCNYCTEKLFSRWDNEEN